MSDRNNIIPLAKNGGRRAAAADIVERQRWVISLSAAATVGELAARLRGLPQDAYICGALGFPVEIVVRRRGSTFRDAVAPRDAEPDKK